MANSDQATASHKEGMREEEEGYLPLVPMKI